MEFSKGWQDFFIEQSNCDYYKQLKAFVNAEYNCATCYPPKDYILQAFKLTPFEQVKVVILGQDPYINYGQAHGLCFSVAPPTACPPSLVNIYKALNYDLGIPITKKGDLTSWAKQGVLLLNSVLTVREKMPQSHAKKGWETFTDNVIRALNATSNPIVFMLWGGYAKSKASLISNPNHLILTSVHPSPLSFYHGFLESKHFSQANDFLTKHNISPIDWGSHL